MWISTRAQYGLRAIVDVAAAGTRPTSLARIARAHGLSQGYLEQIFSTLRRAGIVESIRGARGGYRLRRAPSDVTVLAVVETLEGSVAPVTCIDDATSCERTGACSTESVWRDVDDAVRAVLSATTVADLLARKPLVDIEAFDPSLLPASTA